MNRRKARRGDTCSAFVPMAAACLFQIDDLNHVDGKGAYLLLPNHEARDWCGQVARILVHICDCLPTVGGKIAVVHQP